MLFCGGFGFLETYEVRLVWTPTVVPSQLERFLFAHFLTSH